MAAIASTTGTALGTTQGHAVRVPEAQFVCRLN